MLQNQEISKKEKYNIDKLQKRLRRNVGEAIADFNMIEEGDRIMVCLSGGKDSYTMLEILRNLQKSAPISFSLVAVNLDQKQPGFPEHILPAYLEQLGLNTRLSKRTPTASSKRRSRKENHLLAVLSPASRHPLSYRHRAQGDQDRPRPSSRRYPADAVLNMFYGGKMKGMPPKLMSDDGKHIVIRPLAYCREKDIERFSGPKASRLFRATCAVRSQTCSAGDRRYAPRLGQALSRAH